MTLSEEQLARIIRKAVKSAISEAVTKARTTKILSGTVEQLDTEDLDVVFVRMDNELIGADPSQSMNYEEPGVIPATRLGETFTNEQVRVEFDGAAGASATRTSAQTRLVLPFGAEDGQRIVIEGADPGIISFYDENGILVATLDPLGGFRLRSTTDKLVTLIDQQGYQLRSADSGAVTAEIRHGSIRLVDPVGTDDIEMVTSSGGTLPNPSYTSAVESSPGSSLVVPTAPIHGAASHDDLEIGHVAAWLAVTQQSATMTPPSGWTERHDGNFTSDAGTLQQSVATRDPATGASGTFTSTESNWQRAVGSHVVVHGGEGLAPTFRSLSTAQTAVSGAKTTVSISKPSGVVQGDALITFVAMGVRGGFVPTGWTTPDGFVFLGANFHTAGSGTGQSTVAVGVWAKLAGASEPSTYSTTINLPTGLKAIHGVMVAVQNPYLVPGGVQIRMAGHPIRRLLAFNELDAASTTLCDFQNIPQSYDNLELIIDAISNQNGATSGSVARYRARFNNDSGTNYFFQRTEFQDNNTTAQVAEWGGSDTRLVLGVVNGLDGSSVSAICNILGYCRVGGRRNVHASTYSVIGSLGASIRNGKNVGEYLGGAINRVAVSMDGSPQRFGIGSRAYLYGY